MKDCDVEFNSDDEANDDVDVVSLTQWISLGNIPATRWHEALVPDGYNV